MALKLTDISELGSVNIGGKGLISIIGTNNLTLSGTDANHCGLSFATNAILPAVQSATTNGVVDLGATSENYKDGHFTGNLHLSAGAGGKAVYFFGTDVNWRIGTNLTSDSGGIVTGHTVQLHTGGAINNLYGFQILGHQTNTSPCFEVAPTHTVATSITNIRGNLYIANTPVIDNSRNITATTFRLNANSGYAPLVMQSTHRETVSGQQTQTDAWGWWTIANPAGYSNAGFASSFKVKIYTGGQHANGSTYAEFLVRCHNANNQGTGGMVNTEVFELIRQGMDDGYGGYSDCSYFWYYGDAADWNTGKIYLKIRRGDREPISVVRVEPIGWDTNNTTYAPSLTGHGFGTDGNENTTRPTADMALITTQYAGFRAKGGTNNDGKLNYSITGAVNGASHEIGRFINQGTGATSSYLYIGASSGTDWRVGKNVFGTSGNADFVIAPHSGTTASLKIDPSSHDATFAGDIISGGSSKSIKTFRRWYMDGNADFGINNAAGSSVLLISGGGTPSTSTVKFEGKVGIGVTPQAKLNLSLAAGANIRFDNPTTSRYFTIGEGVGVPDKFSFRGNSYRSTDTLSIDFANNRVGVNQISPTSTFHVVGDANITSNATIQGNLIGKSDNTTEVGTYSTGAIKRIRMAQGGELHFGDTTTSNFLGLTEGAVNNFGDQDRLGLYCRNELKIYGNSNGLMLTMATGGDTAFVGKVSVNGAAQNSSSAELDVNLTQSNGALGAANSVHFGAHGAHTNGQIMGITLGYKENTNVSYRKLGIVAAGRGDGAARQDLHLLVDTAADSGSVALTDSKLKIDGLTGTLYVNGTSSSHRFSVGGDVNVDGSTDLMINGASRRISFTSGSGTVKTTTGNSLILQTDNSDGIVIDGSTQSSTFGGIIRAQNGTITNPSIVFDSDPDTGMWRNGTNALAFSTAGENRLNINSAGKIAVNKQILGVRKNHMTTEDWGVGGFNMTGHFGGDFTGGEATNAYGIGPYETRELIQETVPDSGNDFDGGWNKQLDNLDINKAYMSIVYVKRVTSQTSGSFYHGTGAGTNQIFNLNGTSNTNPYFVSVNIATLPQDVWCVSVGYIQANNDSNTTEWAQRGVYRLDTGARVYQGTTYKMGSAGATLSTGHRVFLYYSNDNTSKLQFARPGHYEVNGHHPTINELVNPGGFARQGDTETRTFGDITIDHHSNTDANLRLHANSTGINTDYAWNLTAENSADNYAFRILQGGSAVMTIGNTASGQSDITFARNLNQTGDMILKSDSVACLTMWDSGGVGWSKFHGPVKIDHNDGLYIKSNTSTFHRIYHNTSTNDLAFSNAAGGDFDFENWVRVRNGAAGTINFEVDSTGGHTGIGGSRSTSYELYVHGTTYSTGAITSAADVVAYSDKKLKKNIETLDGSKVLEMRGVSFTRKDTEKEGSGVIAQEIEKIAPELVHEAADGTLGVAYGNLTGYLIEAIKDLKAEVEELKNHKCDGCTK